MPQRDIGRTPPYWQQNEHSARRWIEDRGFIVHDANLIFRANCPNIDLIVYAQYGAVYVQVKSSSKAAGKDCVVIDGSPWTEQQLYQAAPIFNKHDYLLASFVILIDSRSATETQFCVIPVKTIEALLRERALIFAEKPKRNGERRSISFRKELPREVLTPWLNAWTQFGEPIYVPELR